MINIRTTPVGKRVLTGAHPDLIGCACPYYFDDSNYLLLEVTRTSMQFALYNGEQRLSTMRPVAEFTALTAASSQRTHAVYSALAYMVAHHTLQLDYDSVFHHLLSVCDKVAKHVGNDESDDSYWKMYGVECGFDDQDLMMSFTYVESLRDLFYEFMQFDFTSPEDIGHWARIYKREGWYKVTAACELRLCVDVDGVGTVPMVYIEKLVHNTRHSRHVVTEADAVDDLPEFSLALTDFEYPLTPEMVKDVEDQLPISFSVELTDIPDSATEKMVTINEDSF